MSNFLVSVFCEDRPGLIASIAGRLFELGGNLGDTTFAVLGEAAEFATVVEMPPGFDPDELTYELRGEPTLRNARTDVTPFGLGAIQDPSGGVTHRIMVSGGDRPGLIARLAEVFVQFDANIVRLNAQRVPGADGGILVTRIEASIPPRAAAACLATIANTAGELTLDCRIEPA